MAESATPKQQNFYACTGYWLGTARYPLQQGQTSDGKVESDFHIGIFLYKGEKKDRDTIDINR